MTTKRKNGQGHRALQFNSNRMGSFDLLPSLRLILNGDSWSLHFCLWHFHGWMTYYPRLRRCKVCGLAAVTYRESTGLCPECFIVTRAGVQEGPLVVKYTRTVCRNTCADERPVR